MNPIRPLLAAALLCTGLSDSLAQTVPKVYVTAPRAGTQALGLGRLDADSRFEMASGRTMVVSFAGPDTVHMRYGRHLRRQLKAVGPGRFVSSDGRIELAFALDAQGWIDQVHLSLPADSV
jgi:hypothetical protein